MSENRVFQTSAAVRYDRALHKSLKMNPLPAHVAVPQPTGHWPSENVALLGQYRAWLAGIGSAESVINQHRIPMAGHVLGLNLKPYHRLNLQDDFDKALHFIEAKQKSDQWQSNCRHSLRWFRRFVKESRGLAIVDKPHFGDVSRYQADLPSWLVEQLTRYLHIRQANWRSARMAQATYQFWCQSTRIWRWLFANTEIQQPHEVTREHLFHYMDEQLVAKYQVSSINNDLYTFQATLRFLHQQGVPVSHATLTLPGLKKPAPLPRFLTDGQVMALRDDLTQQVEQAKTPAATRNNHIDLAAFYLLWQSGMRVSELEDLCLDDIDIEAGSVIIRKAKGLKDRAVYLTQPVIQAIQGYLAVRGPALSNHLFIYRHKPLSKDLIRCRLKTASLRLEFKVTPTC